MCSLNYFGDDMADESSTNTKLNLKKVAVFISLALGAYAVYRIVTKKESVKHSVEEAIEKPVKIAKTVLKKGSAEAKAMMAKVRSARTSKGGRKKGTKNKKKADARTNKDFKEAAVAASKQAKMIAARKQEAITDSQIIKKYDLKGKAAEAVKSGKVIKKIQKKKSVKKKSSGHKGHATKRGLAQDQKRISKEKHEKTYQNKKSKR